MTEARGGYHWPGSLGGREAGVMTGVAQRAATTGRRGRLGSGRLGTGGGAGFVLAACAALVLMVPAEASVAGRAQLVGGPDRVRVGPVLEVSRGCAGQNAEVEQAVDYPYVYEAWIGCGCTTRPGTGSGASAALASPRPAGTRPWRSPPMAPSTSPT